VTKRSRIVLAILVGSAVAAIPALLQSHFKAGSFPDLICEMRLLPGKVIARFFRTEVLQAPSFYGAPAQPQQSSLAFWPTGFFTTENSLKKALDRSPCDSRRYGYQDFTSPVTPVIEFSDYF
jgi:hypothetical protein